MKSYSITFLIVLLLVSCKNFTSTEADYAFFGGEIINPSNDHITLSNTLGGKDTLYLDKNNRFLHKIDSLKPGLYSFTHGGEFQTHFYGSPWD